MSTEPKIQHPTIKYLKVADRDKLLADVVIIDWRSIVEELFLNAIDAGAKNVKIWSVLLITLHIVLTHRMNSYLFHLWLRILELRSWGWWSWDFTSKFGICRMHWLHQVLQAFHLFEVAQSFAASARWVTRPGLCTDISGALWRAFLRCLKSWLSPLFVKMQHTAKKSGIQPKLTFMTEFPWRPRALVWFAQSCLRADDLCAISNKQNFELNTPNSFDS